ncbi:steroid alpha reductase-like protein [Calycina marina]|uniref:very-long-chain enoyl-CoA reductase n=1 Tax=Calycina marina TaxID=1763456 RepID=A0A9P7YU18_9HELO|nr:steroid alpha reductase-like protein [Calycina marina]
MSSTIKVTPRSTRKPIKNLPTSTNITDQTTVEDVKIALARQANNMDHNRLGLYDAKKKILRDRRALIRKNKDVFDAQEIFVKDLGPQISWLTVFVIEYAGPIVIHLLFLPLRKYLYSSNPPLSSSQRLSMAMIIIHFLKREYETLYVHRFSLGTMPVRNIFKNSAHYWVLSGVNIAYWVYGPNSATAKSSSTINAWNTVGLLLFIFAEISNYQTHLTLSNLRTPGGTERGIPKGYGFDLVTCPNYFFEILAWTGVLMVTKSLGTVVFLIFATGQMYQWAWKKERALRAEFPDRYKKKKTVLVPFLAI